MNFPLVLQDSWLLDSILAVTSNYVYNLKVIDKSFIKSVHSLQKTPVLRIFKFLKTTSSSGLTAVMADATHKVLAYFPYDTIFKFELKFRRRLTQNSLNSLIMINDACLRFANSIELSENFGFQAKKNVSIVILEILAVDLFSKDQVPFAPNIEIELKFLYYAKRYIEIFSDLKNSTAPLDSKYESRYNGNGNGNGDGDDDDDLISL